MSQNSSPIQSLISEVGDGLLSKEAAEFYRPVRLAYIPARFFTTP